MEKFYRHFSGPFDWSWIVTPKQHKYDGKVYHYFKFELPLEYTKEPFLVWSESQYESRIEWRRWESTVCPAAREAWLCRGIDAIASNLDWHSALWADTAFLEGLQESSASWGRVEARLACFGLGCKEKGQFGLSLELVAEALKRGQIEPTELGEALADCANSQMIKMNRWAKAISELALIAPLPALCQAWELFLARVDAKVDIGKLLPSLLQVATQAQHHFSSQESRAKLESYQGKNAAGKAAVKLLKI